MPTNQFEATTTTTTTTTTGTALHCSVGICCAILVNF
jgi:hypothetical protein